MSLFRPGEAGYPLRDGQEGGHQDHQQGEAERVRAAEGRAGDCHHEAYRASERPLAVRCLREPEGGTNIPSETLETFITNAMLFSVPVPGAGAREWGRTVRLPRQEGPPHAQGSEKIF